MSAGAGYEPLAEAVGRLLPAPGRPVLVGVAGAVSVGKSTAAEALAGLLAAAGARVEVLCTDCFLLPNAVLAERGTAMRKGFPETFDGPAMERCLGLLRAGGGPVEVPVYSHAVYDVVPGTARRVGPADVVVVEGVNALQPPVVGHLDLPVYLHAEQEHVRAWFVQRFLGLCAAAEQGGAGAEESFYRMFAGMSLDERTAVAHGAWDGVNLPNLLAHVLPSRAAASLVVRKGADHTVLDVSPPA